MYLIHIADWNWISETDNYLPSNLTIQPLSLIQKNILYFSLLSLPNKTNNSTITHALSKTTSQISSL